MQLLTAAPLVPGPSSDNVDIVIKIFSIKWHKSQHIFFLKHMKIFHVIYYVICYFQWHQPYKFKISISVFSQ